MSDDITDVKSREQGADEKLRGTDMLTENQAEMELARFQNEKEDEDRIDREIAQARRDVDTAASMSGGSNPKIEELRSQLQGDAKTIDPNKVRDIAREARELAAEETQSTVMGGALSLATLGAVLGAGQALLNSNVTLSGANIPVAAQFTEEVQNGMENSQQAPRRELEGGIGGIG